jgi:hypothetical protein
MATAPSAAAAAARRVALLPHPPAAEEAVALPPLPPLPLSFSMPLPVPVPVPVPDPTAPAPAAPAPAAHHQTLFSDATWMLRMHRDAQRRAAKLAVQRRVASVVKSMHGDIFGQALYNALAGPHDKVDVTRMHARLNPGLVAMLVDVLRTDYDLHALTPGRKYMVLPLPPVPPSPAPDAAAPAPAPPALDFEPFELYLTGAYKDRWTALPFELDVQQLSMDGWKVYLRAPPRPEALVPRANRLEHLIDRVQRRVFAVADPRAFRPAGAAAAGSQTPPAATAAAYVHAAKAYRRAYKYVRDGWTMDDAALGPRAFVVNRWATLQAACPHRCAAHASAADGVCPLCHEVFQPHDVVVNLPCCHTFHCYCVVGPPPAGTGGASLQRYQNEDTRLEDDDDDPDAARCRRDTGARYGSGGLYTWLLDQGKDTCPVCRAGLLLLPA